MQAGKFTIEGCAKLASCRNTLIEKGLGALLGVATAQTALDALSDSEKQYVLTVATLGRADLIEKLTPEQRAAYDYMVEQDRKAIFSLLPHQPGLDEKKTNPNHTGGDQIAVQGPTNTGGDQLAPQGPTHTGNNDGQVDIGPNHTGNNTGAPDIGNIPGTPIPQQPSIDDIAYLALKGKEAQKAAGNLGFDHRIAPQKAPFNSHGQPVYFNGKTYITPDVDSHNVTNGWKMFDRKGNRMGTYDSKLNRIKD